MSNILSNIEVIKDHAQTIDKLLIDINNHKDVIEKHGGEIKIMRLPDGKWVVSSVNMEIEVER